MKEAIQGHGWRQVWHTAREKTKTALDLETAEHKQGSQKSFSANIFFWNPLLVFVVGCGMAESASFLSLFYFYGIFLSSPQNVNWNFAHFSAWRNPP